MIGAESYGFATGAQTPPFVHFASERNTRRMPLRYWCALAGLYQTSIDYLLGRTDAAR